MYRARDSRLHREVALKILPEATSGEAAAEARFEREAQRSPASIIRTSVPFTMSASMGPPVSRHGAAQGETLQQRLLRGAFDIPVLRNTPRRWRTRSRPRTITGASFIATETGQHLLTSHGHLKILDFGLAKATDSQSLPTDRPTPLIISSPGGDYRWDRGVHVTRADPRRTAGRPDRYVLAGPGPLRDDDR